MNENGEILDDLEAKGQLRPASGHPGELRKISRVTLTDQSTADLLADLRGYDRDDR